MRAKIRSLCFVLLFGFFSNSSSLAGIIDFQGSGRTIDWAWWDLNDWWYVNFSWEAHIETFVKPDGNILRYASNRLAWKDKDWLPDQGDGRYVNYTGPFSLVLTYYYAPGRLRDVVIATVYYTNGTMTAAYSGTGPNGRPANTGSAAARKLRQYAQWLQKVGGPVQLATGAESSTRPLFSFHGARPWTFDISYNSSLVSEQIAEGPLGLGWTHAFEARVKSSGSNLILQWDKCCENTFSPKPGTPGSFVSSEDRVRYDTLAEQIGGGWLLTRRNQSTLLFDAAGRLVEDRDPTGKRLVISYNSNGQISSIHDPISSTSLSFIYDSGTGRVIQLVDALGHTVTLEYSSTGYINKIINQNSRQVTLSYNVKGELLTLADHGGNVLTTNTYDDLGRVTAQDDGISGNQVMGFQYEEVGLPGNTVYAGSDASKEVPLALPTLDYRINSVTGLNGATLTYIYAGAALAAVVVNSQITAINYDAQGNVVSVTDPAAQTTSISSGVKVNFTDRTGKTWLYDFGPDYRMRSVKNPLNQTSHFTYDSQGNLLTAKDALNQTSTYTYDNRGNMLAHTDPAGKVTSMTYDARNNLLTTTDPLNQTTTRTYDSKNNLLTITDALGRTTTWTYNSDSLPVTMTIPGGGLFQYVYTSGRLTQTTDPMGVIVKFGYDSNGRRLFEEDSAGKRTNFTYDGVGNLLTITNALNQVTTYTYDHRNRPLTMTDPLGAVSSYAYDHNNNLATITDALGKITTMSYDGEDRVKTIKDPTNRVVSATYDDAGRTISTSDPGSNVTSFEYDAAGQLTAMQDPMLRRVTTTYDTRGLPLTITDPLSRTRTFTYDNAGRRTTEKDPLLRTKTLSYDALNRNVSVNDAGNLVTSQTFDVNGNRTTIVNPLSHATTFSFDAAGRRTSTTTPEGRATTYTYNGKGLHASTTEPSGQARVVTYDDARRVSSISDSVGTITITRDAVGRTLATSEGSKTLTREYDLLGRLKKYIDGAGSVVQYGYDDAGRLVKLIYPDLKEVTYGYDTAGRLQSVTDWASRTTTYSYNAAGQLTQMLRPNATRQTRAYDSAGQLTQLREVGSDGATILFAADSITYDLAGQLTGETLNPPVAPVAYSAAQTFDRDNRLLTHNGAAATFDPDGNLLAVASGVAPANYTYDTRNRLTGAGGLTYTYDSENRRVAVTDASGTTSYVVNPQPELDQILVRTGPDGTKTYYVYGLRLLHEETGPLVRYYHFDRRGDTVALTDGTGSITDRMAYGSYGEVLHRSGNAKTPFLFNGQLGVQTDSNGLYNHRSRYYHSSLRRFLNQDVLIGEVALSASLNRFAYANGNPVSFIDPFGFAASDIAQNAWEQFKLWPGWDSHAWTGLEWWAGDLASAIAYINYQHQNLVNLSNDPFTRRALEIAPEVLALYALEFAQGFKIARIEATAAENAAVKLTQSEASALSKINNILNKGIKPGPKGDISGAVADMVGAPIPKPGGGVWDHAQDLGGMLRGLRNNAAKLSNSTDPAAVAARQQAQQMIQTIEAAIKGNGL